MKKTKMKGVSFNLTNPIEKFMFDEAANEGSFSALMKYLYLNYLANQGRTPPGFSGTVTVNAPSSIQAPPIQLQQQEEDTEGILNANFSLDD